MPPSSVPLHTPTPSHEPGIPRLDIRTLTHPGKNPPLGAVLVCPGGGYSMRAEHEGEKVARAFNNAGLHAFVLQYRVKPARHPAPLSDAVQAMRYIRSHAGEWDVSPDHIAVCGFSAGGHLAGSLALAYDDPGLTPKSESTRLPSARPDALILSYAVISSGEFAHKGSFDRLFGRDASNATRSELSLEHRVRNDSPPAFIWHTADDSAVPVENALEFAAAMRRAQRPFEMHIYAHGRHGLGLADDGDAAPRVKGWIDLCVEWLAEMGWPTASGT